MPDVVASADNAEGCCSAHAEENRSAHSELDVVVCVQRLADAHVSEGFASQHASEGCASYGEHAGIFCVRVVAFVEQPSSAHSFDLDEVCCSSSESCDWQGLVCVVVAPVPDGPREADDGEDEVPCSAFGV